LTRRAGEGKTHVNAGKQRPFWIAVLLATIELKAHDGRKKTFNFQLSTLNMAVGIPCHEIVGLIKSGAVHESALRIHP